MVKKHGGPGHNEPPDEPTFNARSSDPSTSHAGAVWSEGKQRDKMVVWAIHKTAHPYQLTTFEMEARAPGGHRNGKYRKRMCDLIRDGWLVYTGIERINPASGKPQRAYKISDNPRPLPTKPKKVKHNVTEK